MCLRLIFLSTLSLRRATGLITSNGTKKLNFYPRSPCGERLLAVFRLGFYVYFYPRSPCGERPRYSGLFDSFDVISIHALLAESDASNHRERQAQHISIHALLAESDSVRPGTRRRDAISIHALLAESDVAGGSVVRSCKDFYPRSPCGERRNNKYTQEGCQQFLSTLSLRRATIIKRLERWAILNFYPRSPCGERPISKVWEAR